MVKSCKKMCFSLCSERFFKVFLPDRSSKRMKLPPAFLKNFDGTLPFKSTIISPMKSSWQVDLEKVGDHLYFHKGWEKFVQHHSLEDGDFLVFVYGNNAIFHVKIYGKNGCEKESTYPTEEHCRALSLLKENQLVIMNELNSLEHKSTRKNFEKVNKALEKADKFNSDLPFFKLEMRPSYITRGYMNIPAFFIKKHMGRIKKGASLVYSDKSWPVQLAKSAKHIETKFAIGSLAFTKDNALAIGDVCVFELVDVKDEYVFVVSIFRSCSD